MKKLRFQIRTWNRAKKLEICVRRIAEEVIKIGAEKDCIIFVIDNCSSDSTPKVLKKLKKEFPFIVTYRYPKWCKMGEFLPIPDEILEKTKAEFIWNMGDDDIILKDTLPLVWNLLNSDKTKNFAIIHVANASLSPHSYKTYEGTVLEFANLMGFNQFLGYSPSVIFNFLYREEKFKEWGEDYIQEVFFKKYRPLYQTTAFPHVLFYLHFFAYDPAIVIDYPIVEPMSPQQKEDAERWEKENIGWKYFLVPKALKFMYEEGILKEKLKPGFFKYLNYNLWDRFLTEMIAARLGIYTRNPRPDEGWKYILDIADLIDDPTIVKQIRTNVYLARGLCKEYQFLKKKLETISDKETLLKKDLENRLNEMKKTLLETYQEIIKPVFEEGWAGRGYKK